MSKSKSQPESASPRAGGAAAAPGSFYEYVCSPATRETVESIVVAIVLAFLFRGFIAEAFVIPTGSMAPTLQGSHKDVKCPQCGIGYRTGASSENFDQPEPARRDVVQTTCPVCRFERDVDTDRDKNDATFTGDRILVSKFAYQLGEPKRWDVIVFKYPGNAKQNYIKRLVGLPNEEIKIRHGDVFVRGPDDGEFHIARKDDPRKLVAVLQLVGDTQHIARDLAQAGWPSRWQPWRAGESNQPWTRTCENDAQGIVIESSDGQAAWLRYRHFVPSVYDWDDIRHGVLPDGLHEREGQLIDDFYAYNGYILQGRRDIRENGLHWVGDLALECEIRTESSSGGLLLDLVEGGVHYQCRIDLGSGAAELTIGGGQGQFTDGATVRTATTRVKGPGRYNLRFANVDDQLRMWVNDRLVEFDGAATYANSADVVPKWTPGDPLDLAPAGIAAEGCQLQIDRLRILRDVYYVAAITGSDDEYEGRSFDVEEIFRTPSRWANNSPFDHRRELNFALGADQFFPMGDNSPQSKDARLWHTDDPYENYVERRLLTGKALLIYWPHAWNRPIPLLPNFQRMGLIR